MPRIQTVANLAIAGLNSGYSNLKLYGVDHTFLSNWKSVGSIVVRLKIILILV
jgi:hypothetical protein